MWIKINHEWLEKNKTKLLDASDETGYLVIESPDNAESVEINEGKCFLIENTGGDNPNVSVCMDWQPTQEEIGYFIEDLSLDNLVKVFELATKKINKCKSLIENAITL